MSAASSMGCRMSLGHRRLHLSLGRAVSRTFTYCGGPSGQVRALATRRRTAMNGGVRGIFAGYEFPANHARGRSLVVSSEPRLQTEDGSYDTLAQCPS
jgi:hypothetical protein